MGYKRPIQSVMNSPAQIISTLWPTTPLLLIYNSRDHHTSNRLQAFALSSLISPSSSSWLTHSLLLRAPLQRHLLSEIFTNHSFQRYKPSFHFFTFSHHLPYCYVFNLWLIVCLFVQECKLHTYKVFCCSVHHWISNSKVSVLCSVLNTHKMNNEYLPIQILNRL